MPATLITSAHTRLAEGWREQAGGTDRQACGQEMATLIELCKIVSCGLGFHGIVPRNCSQGQQHCVVGLVACGVCCGWEMGPSRFLSFHLFA